MATTFITFNPDPASNFQFLATLDGQSYTVIVRWNLYGQRYYVNVYTTQGALVICFPMIGSPVGYNISLVGPLFTSQLVWRIQNNQFEVIS